MKRTIGLVLVVIIYTGCGPMVLEPPLVDLFSMEKIGLIAFNLEEAEGNLGQMATQRFLQEIQWAQRGVQVVELGTEEEVLASIEQERLGPEAAKAIGDKYGLTAFFTGSVRVSDIRPEIDLATIIKTLSVRASFTIEITGRLIGTDSSVTVWTDSVADKKSVARLSLSEGHIPWFDLRSQDKIYRKMIDRLVMAVTRDFRPTKHRLSP